jgi:FAD-linked sulfhydryl oxidase
LLVEVLLFTLSQFLLVATTTFFNPPARTYINPWTGELFGDGGVETLFESQPTAKATENEDLGGVIMGKLGNATAK